MSILIKGMQMPEQGLYGCLLVVTESGAYIAIDNDHDEEDDYDVIILPPHGRLIDADALFKEMERKGWWDNNDRDIAEDLVLDAPTIISAEEVE